MDFKKFLNRATKVSAAIILGAILGTIAAKIEIQVREYFRDPSDLDSYPLDYAKNVSWYLEHFRNINKNKDPHDRPCIRTCGCTCFCYNDVECKCFCLVCNEINRMREDNWVNKKKFKEMNDKREKFFIPTLCQEIEKIMHPELRD